MKTKLDRCEPTEEIEIENSHTEKTSLEELLKDLPEGCEVVTDAWSAHTKGIQRASESERAGDGLDDFLVAHSLEPDHPLYAADFALALDECERHQEAKQVAIRMVQNAEHMCDYDLSSIEYNRIGIVCASVLDDSQLALPWFAKACELDPDDIELRLSYARALLKCGYEDQAGVLGEKTARKLENLNNLSSDQAYQLARAAQMICKLDSLRAGLLVQKALDAAPDHPEVLLVAGVIAIDREDHLEAVGYFRKAARLAPDNERVWGGLQYALHSQGLFEDAISVGRDILKKWPEYSDVRFNVASAALNMGWHKEAEDELLEFLSRDPDDALAHISLGVCFALQNKATDARREQQRALELDGEDPEVQRLSTEIDRILDSNQGPSLDQVRSYVLLMLAAARSRSERKLS